MEEKQQGWGQSGRMDFTAGKLGSWYVEMGLKGSVPECGAENTCLM